MPIPKKLLLEIDLSSLICSLYTLSETNQLFKKLDLKNDIVTYINYKDYFHELYQLLNNTSLRRFVFKLLKPILNNTYLKNSSIKTQDNINIIYKEETVLLQKYLKKFKHNYYYYYQNENFENSSTEKEINLSALKSLFLIVGI